LQPIAIEAVLDVPNGNSVTPPVLQDYSKNAYTHQRWSAECWWGKNVVIVGDVGSKKDHPVAVFLAREGKARSVAVHRQGFEALKSSYPFLCSSSIKTNHQCRYPSQLDPMLYIGDWSHSEAHDRLLDLGITAMITIHNNPERAAAPPGGRHLQVMMADVETAHIAPWFGPSFDFIEEARAAGHGEWMMEDFLPSLFFFFFYVFSLWYWFVKQCCMPLW
jgi:dual specificity MAP kinase phosphatase